MRDQAKENPGFHFLSTISTFFYHFPHIHSLIILNNDEIQVVKASGFCDLWRKGILITYAGNYNGWDDLPCQSLTTFHIG